MTPATPVLGVLGDLVEDVVAWLAEPLRPATDTAVTLARTRGGSGANVAAFAARLVPTRFIGCVGADGAGDALVADLAAHGVDVRVQRAGTTGAVLVLVDPSGERSMLPDRGASRLIGLDGVDPALIDDLAHLHVPAYSFDGDPTSATAIALLRSVRTRGATTSVDASSVGMLAAYGRAAFLDLMGDLRPTHLLANAEEAAFLGVGAAGHEGAGRPAPLGATVVVVKDGPDPTIVLVPGEPPLVVPVPPVDAVRDLTGAGDAFAAGFLAAVLGGAGLRAACEAGHASAAPVLGAPGASRPDRSGSIMGETGS